MVNASMTEQANAVRKTDTSEFAEFSDPSYSNLNYNPGVAESLGMLTPGAAGAAGGGGVGGTVNTAMDSLNSATGSAANILGMLGQGAGAAGPLGWAQFGVNTAGQIASMFGPKMSPQEQAAWTLKNALSEQELARRGHAYGVLEQLAGMNGPGGANNPTIRQRYEPVREAAGIGVQTIKDAIARLPANASLEDILKQVQPLASRYTAAQAAVLAPQRREALRRITEGSPSSVQQQSSMALAAQQDLESQLAQIEAEKQYQMFAEQRRAAATDEATRMAGMGAQLPQTAEAGVSPELSALLSSLRV